MAQAFELANRAALRRAFYRLTGTSADDDQLSEHDSEALEAVHYYLHRGLWSAQEYIITVGSTSRWVKRGALAWATDADGLRYADLPDDFLRLAGSERESALSVARGGWGRLVEGEHASTSSSDYWVEGERLYAGKGVSIPAGLVVAYHYRHAIITTDDAAAPAGAIDFPVLDRPLIVAFAAFHHSQEPSFLGNPSGIMTNLAAAKAEAARRARVTGEPRKLRPPPSFGTHWM